MTETRLIEETSYAIEDLYNQWQKDPSLMLIEDERILP